MPIFEKPPIETLALAKDRWTPIYLEHGRLEVDDSSVKWLGANGLLCRIPIATISAVLLGPGTTVTHAAVKACADSNTPICWIGEDGMRYYATGTSPTHDNTKAKTHAALHADRKKREQIARQMFLLRFPDGDVASKSINELRGMEGLRVRTQYAQMGQQYGVTWKGRNYDQNRWETADGINRAVSAANASFYALVLAVVCSMGYIPTLGFVHETGTIPFVYDIADLYKQMVTLPAAFRTIRDFPNDDGEQTRRALKELVEAERLLQRIPKDIDALLKA